MGDRRVPFERSRAPVVTPQTCERSMDISDRAGVAVARRGGGLAIGASV